MANKKLTAHAVVHLDCLRAGGRASGGQVVGRYRATEAMHCECCRCHIYRGQLVYEVLTEADVLEVCAECVGLP